MKVCDPHIRAKSSVSGIEGKRGEGVSAGERNGAKGEFLTDEAQPANAKGVGLKLIAALLVLAGLGFGANQFLSQERSSDESSVTAKKRPEVLLSFSIRKPVGARVFVDDIPWKEFVPTIVTGLKPGEHTLRLELEGYQLKETTIVLTKDTPLVVQEELVALAATLILESSPSSASIFQGKIFCGEDSSHC